MDASRAEIKIKEILQMNDVDFVQEYTVPGLNSSNGRPLRFDFCIYDPDGNIDFLLEYQGKQHYEPSAKFGGKRGFYQQQFNDNKKRRYCALHGINLVEISYQDEWRLSYDYIMERAYGKDW